MNIRTSQITHLAGRVIDFDEMQPNSIAIDGAVQGPRVEAATRRFSFDHHGGCVRLVTLAACQQVWQALKLGLVVDENTTVYVNDIDADTSMAVWLLIHPEVVHSEIATVVGPVVDAIGETDAHGPAMGVHPLHGGLFRPPTDPGKGTLRGLFEDLDKIDGYFDGSYEPEKKAYPGEGWASRDGRTWERVSTGDGFSPLYLAGYKVGVIGAQRDDGTMTWTAGKVSDLFPFPLGPAKSKMADLRYDTTKLLGFLAFHEEEYFGQAQETNWGGGSSIGGSPRNPDGSSSQLGIQQMGEVLRDFSHSVYGSGSE